LAAASDVDTCLENLIRKWRLYLFSHEVAWIYVSVTKDGTDFE